MAENIVAYSVIPNIKSCKLMHRKLLQYLEQKIAATPRGEVVTLILGSGGEFSPFAYYPGWISTFFRGNKTVCFDYNPRLLENARLYAQKELAGAAVHFLGQGGEINPAHFSRDSFLFVNHNLKNRFPLPDQSVDVVDGTLSIHHALAHTHYTKQLFGEVYRVLKNGGKFHIGEASVNMRRSEENILTLIRNFDGEARVLDLRDEDFPFSVGSSHSSLEFKIDAQGKVTVPYTLGTMRALEGYSLQQEGDLLAFPLIDPTTDSDFVDEICQYYLEGDREKFELVSSLGQARIAESLRLAIEEHHNAVRGLVEFYSPIDYHLKHLRDVGFSASYEFSNPERAPLLPFVNIYAEKASV